MTANESFFLYGVENTGFAATKKPTITSDDEVIVQIKKTGYVCSPPHDTVSALTGHLVSAIESAARMFTICVMGALE